MRTALLSLLILLAAGGAIAQQVADSAFAPPIANPAFPVGEGPVVMIDAAHHNFHTADGRYYTFARLLMRDGYRVISSEASFTAETLGKGQILVVSNALNERNTEDWSLPTPSAFTPEEVAAVREWVHSGGSLLLIADHMPFPGAAGDLAAALGFQINNGFALDTASDDGGTYVFRRADNTLADHPITNGRTPAERIDSVVSFTGEAFQADSAVALMTFGAGVSSLMPDVAWEFSDSTKQVDVSGWFQGAVSTVGKGRVAVFGEAAMFSAQLAGPNRVAVGMNHTRAPQNPQFLLNTVHWLSGVLE